VQGELSFESAAPPAVGVRAFRPQRPIGAIGHGSADADGRLYVSVAQLVELHAREKRELTAVMNHIETEFLEACVRRRNKQSISHMELRCSFVVCSLVVGLGLAAWRACDARSAQGRSRLCWLHVQGCAGCLGESGRGNADNFAGRPRRDKNSRASARR
jgi:hypothetical protein